MHMGFSAGRSLIKCRSSTIWQGAGVLSLHCDSAVDRFDDGLVDLLEKLAIDMIGPLLEISHKFRIAP